MIITSYCEETQEAVALRRVSIKSRRRGTNVSTPSVINEQNCLILNAANLNFLNLDFHLVTPIETCKEKMRDNYKAWRDIE